MLDVLTAAYHQAYATAVPADLWQRGIPVGIIRDGVLDFVGVPSIRRDIPGLDKNGNPIIGDFLIVDFYYTTDMHALPLEAMETMELL